MSSALFHYLTLEDFRDELKSYVDVETIKKLSEHLASEPHPAGSSVNFVNVICRSNFFLLVLECIFSGVSLFHSGVFGCVAFEDDPQLK